MSFFEPLKTGFTIYSKPGCPNCTNVKRLLFEKEIFYLDVECANYLLEDKEGFLAFIRERANKEWKIFPMVFKDGKFVGGFAEVKLHFDKLECFGGDI